MTFYSRHLPHWHPPGKDIFLTWRLCGSLPAGIAMDIRNSRAASAGEKFRRAERVLDNARIGPAWLRDPRIAEIIVRSLQYGQETLGQFVVHAYVIMSNHVHILIEPKTPVERITRGIKSATGRESNALLGRFGRPFWQDESFDRWVRSSTEWRRIRAYIERNPVIAGLVARPEDWPWSSASNPL